jgi:hypothetical protein
MYKAMTDDIWIDRLFTDEYEIDMYDIAHDLACVDQYVCNYDEYYTIAFAVNKDPCIVRVKGLSPVKYYWDGPE